jgi:tetratricopeptide (TPR) repeat protein
LNFLLRLLSNRFCYRTPLTCTLLTFVCIQTGGCGLFGSRYETYQIPPARAVTPKELQAGTYLWDTTFRQQSLSYRVQSAHRVAHILTKLIPYTGSQDRWLVHISSAQEADIFVTPGNQIFISEELLSIIKDDNALSVVLAHALGHLVAQDPEAKELFTQFWGSFSQYKEEKQNTTTRSSLSEATKKKTTEQLFRSTRTLTESPWGEAAEEDADVLGSIFLTAAGMTKSQMSSGWYTVEQLINYSAPHLLTKHRRLEQRNQFVFDNYRDFFELAQTIQHRPTPEVSYFISRRTSAQLASRQSHYNDTVMAYTIEGQKALEIKAFQEAEKAFLRAISEQPRDYILRHYLAQVYYQAERYGSAIEQLTQALHFNPFHATSYYYRACSYALSGYNEKALRDLKQALLFAPHLRHLAIEDKDFSHLHGVSSFEKLVSDPTPSLIINVPPSLL